VTNLDYDKKVQQKPRYKIFIYKLPLVIIVAP